jgi:hypothetical protein
VIREPGELEAQRQFRLTSSLILVLAEQRKPTEADFIAAYGPGGSAEFWQNYLFGAVSITSLIYTLARTGAAQFQQIEVVEMALGKAFLEAFHGDEDWFRGEYKKMADVRYFRELKEPGHIKVIAKRAADWLNRNPKWRHLVPPTLAAYLAGQNSPEPLPASTPTIEGGVGPFALPKRPRGPQATKKEAVIAAMLVELRSGKSSPETFAGEKQDAIASRFAVSRDTARKALAEALSKFQPN